MKKKTYEISDLFFTSWNQLPAKAIAEVYALHMRAQSMEKDTDEYGHLVIQVMKRLKKNWRLVDKINVEQCVDIYNALTFLSDPWYDFPFIQGMAQPQDKLSRHTFDHFIYADNEYSSYVVSQDINYLKRLVATLYQKSFDKESVEPLASKLKLKTWQLHLVFYTFAHVRTFVMKRCKTLLPPAPKKLEEDIQEETARPTGAMWLKIKHRLAETPAFQGYDHAGSANMYSTLDYLEDLAQIKEEQSRKR
jgi:hypothetical protein